MKVTGYTKWKLIGSSRLPIFIERKEHVFFQRNIKKQLNTKGMHIETIKDLSYLYIPIKKKKM